MATAGVPITTIEQRVTLAVTIVCIVFITTIVALRFVAARKANRPFDRGDATILATWVSQLTNAPPCSIYMTPAYNQSESSIAVLC